MKRIAHPALILGLALGGMSACQSSPSDQPAPDTEPDAQVGQQAQAQGPLSGLEVQPIASSGKAKGWSPDRFELADARRAPGMKEGGFATEPSFQSDFNGDWKASQSPWRIATWEQNGAQMAKSRAKADGQGHLVQTVLKGKPYRAGSMQTDKEFPYGRWIARIKPTNVPGVLNSMFAKDYDDLTTEGKDGDGLGTEIDIELLSYTFKQNSGKVHLAIHLPGESNAWVADVPIDFNPARKYHVWGFDILPDRVRWHVDGRIVGVWKYGPERKVHENYEMFFNSWSSDHWVHGPAKQDADYHIDWVKFYPYQGKQ